MLGSKYTLRSAAAWIIVLSQRLMACGVAYTLYDALCRPKLSYLLKVLRVINVYAARRCDRDYGDSALN